MLTPVTDSRTGAVAQLFDQLTPFYDQSDVAFFGPIAERLVTLMEPRPGEHAVDLGCGRGAVTTRLARAVGPSGDVVALDVAPGMVAATGDEAARLGPFRSESALAALVVEAGGEVTASVEEALPVRFADVGQWERFSLSTGQRQMWQQVPEAARPGLRAAAERLLEGARPAPGEAIQVSQTIRYTRIGRATHPG